MTNCTDRLLVFRAPSTTRSLPPLPSPKSEGKIGLADVVDVMVLMVELGILILLMEALVGNDTLSDLLMDTVGVSVDIEEGTAIDGIKEVELGPTPVLDNDI